MERRINMKYYDYKGTPCSQCCYEEMRDEWLVKCQKLVDEHMRNYSWEEKLVINEGRRYDKIICVGDNTHSGGHTERVWAFIEKVNGNILKPAGWTGPAKHARGNIYETPSMDGRPIDDSMMFIGALGPAYLDKIKNYYGS